jgi:protoporphyrinogen oxidase
MPGVYAGDHSKLEIGSTLPSLVKYEQESGSLVMGILKSLFNKQPEYEGWTSNEAKLFAEKIKEGSIYSFKGGMQSLSDRLLEDVMDRGVELVHGSCTKVSIDGLGPVLEVSTLALHY